MDFKLDFIDGLAQKGVFSKNNLEILIPSIIYIKIPKVPIPDIPLMILQDDSFNKTNQSYQINLSVRDKKNTLHTLCNIDNFYFFPPVLSKCISDTNNIEISNLKNNIQILCGNPVKHIIKNKEHIRIFIIGHSMQLFYKSSEIGKYLISLYHFKSPEQLVYFPFVANPQNLAVLVYLGINLFDSSQAIIAARNNILFFPEENIPLSTLDAIPCNCPICHAISNPKKMTFHDILFHNYYILNKELFTIHYHIKQETLREYVTIRISNSPHLSSIIRHFECNQFSKIEKYTSRYKKTILKATTIHALHRPEIKRFQQELITKYQKPKHTQILLLLPCSAKKPYSFSQSHKQFNRTITSIKNHHCIHEVIITSPIGLVPRELELMYPASSYDISVTGEWFEDEKKMIASLLKDYLRYNQYEKIIIHLPQSLRSFLIKNIPHALYTDTMNSTTSSESLGQLFSLLKQETASLKTISKKQRLKDNLFSLACVQFSPEIAMELLHDTIIKGKYPFLKIFDIDNQQIGMLTKERGVISLTAIGAKRVQSLKQYYVEISNDFILKGSVFAPGVITADHQIRKGDEVLVFQNERLVGVGVASMNSSDMIKRTNGKAVDIRHKIS